MDSELEDEMVDGLVLARPWTVVLSWFQTGDCGSVLGLPLRLCRNHTAPPTPAAEGPPAIVRDTVFRDPSRLLRGSATDDRPVVRR